MTALFIDTTVLAYAIGGPHEHREPCRRLIEHAATGEVQLHASVEALAELTFHQLRRGPRADALRAARIAQTMLELHPFDENVLTEALRLMDRSALRSRDAVHAATALGAGFSAIVTTDKSFARLPGLRADDPRTVLDLLDAG